MYFIPIRDCLALDIIYDSDTELFLRRLLDHLVVWWHVLGLRILIILVLVSPFASRSESNQSIFDSTIVLASCAGRQARILLVLRLAGDRDITLTSLLQPP